MTGRTTMADRWQTMVDGVAADYRTDPVSAIVMVALWVAGVILPMVAVIVAATS